MTAQFKKLVRRMAEYLSGECPANDLVSEIDNFVSDDYVYELPETDAQAVQNLQDRTAFYVSDPEKRQEFHEYIGDNELRALIQEFLGQHGEIK